MIFPPNPSLFPSTSYQILPLKTGISSWGVYLHMEVPNAKNMSFWWAELPHQSFEIVDDMRKLPVHRQLTSRKPTSILVGTDQISFLPGSSCYIRIFRMNFIIIHSPEKRARKTCWATLRGWFPAIDSQHSHHSSQIEIATSIIQIIDRFIYIYRFIMICRWFSQLDTPKFARDFPCYIARRSPYNHRSAYVLKRYAAVATCSQWKWCTAKRPRIRRVSTAETLHVGKHSALASTADCIA